MLQMFWAAWLNHFIEPCNQCFLSCVEVENTCTHLAKRIKISASISGGKNRISVLEVWTLSSPYPTLWNLLSNEKDYRLMCSILVSLETLELYVSRSLWWLWQFSPHPHLLFKSRHTSSKLAKNCLCIWASIFLFLLFPHLQYLSAGDFLSGVLQWWFRRSLF